MLRLDTLQAAQAACNRFQLPKISVEAGSATLGTLGDLLEGGDGLEVAADRVGEPFSARFQMIIPD